uniref:Glutaredoxin domain-containing protein n=12 Tax=Triticinae TaxID=1648030 RepID=A0A453KEP5_AEGTS
AQFEKKNTRLDIIVSTHLHLTFLRLNRATMTFPMATSTASTAAAASLRLLPVPATPSSRTLRFSPILRRAPRALLSVSALSKLSEAPPVPIPQEATQTLPGEDALPPRPGVYGVFDPAGDLQFLGISRNVRASVEGHRRKVPADLCASVKVAIPDEETPDKSVLTNAWKSWMEEYIAATGKAPPGNVAGNHTWIGPPQRPADLRLTPGRHVQLTVPLEQLIDRLVKENKVVAFIKGSRSAPQCGFSQRVVGILEAHGVDFASVDILDEEHNHGLRETLKTYSNWPTFPQVFVGGELVGGCDIISSMAEKGELAALFQK